MFVGIAKSQNFISAYLLMAVYVVLFKVSGFYVPSKIIIDFPTPLHNEGYLIIQNWVVGNNLLNWISIILLFFQAIWIHVIFQKHSIHHKSSYLVGFFYIMFNSIFHDSIGISSILISNLFVIALIDKLFLLTQTEKYVTTSFDIGVLLSIAVILYFPYCWLFPAIIIALLLFKSFQWRIWIVFFIGFLLPYFIILFFCFWQNDIYYFTKFTDIPFYILQTPFTEINNMEKGILLFLIIMILISFLKLSRNFYKNTVQVRQYHQWLLLCLIFALAFICILPVRLSHTFSMVSIPLSFLLSYYFLVQKNRWYSEILFIILSSVVVYSQFI